MIYYQYSPQQLENKAEELLQQYDPERLIRTKSIDVYAVIEKCLDVPYDWKYITPDQSILGMTAFNTGTTWVWPEAHYTPGMMPIKILLEQGTILIDSTLTESDNRGRENFTVMHEVFHQVLHKCCFARRSGNYIHATTANALAGKKRLVTGLDIIEYQANTCAAAFLMPGALVDHIFCKMSNGKNVLPEADPSLDFLIAGMADKFSVSKQAMKYRLVSRKHIQQ